VYASARGRSISSAITAATSSTGWALANWRESGPPPRAFKPKSVATTPGDTVETWMPGQRSRSSWRRHPVSALSACLAAQ
jgi:hypothetical protein